MSGLAQVHVTPRPIQRFTSLVGEERIGAAEEVGRAVRTRLRGRVLWNVNSTGMGGGVAEMLRTLLAYARGVGIDTRWLVVQGTPEFFRITKRLHHALHGARGDGSPLGEGERQLYEAVLNANAVELAGLLRRGDLVLLHDPQTAGLIPTLRRAGARLIWRCHVGSEARNAEVEAGWAFLEPYLTGADATVFSRAAYRPPICEPERSLVISPSIDPFSPKNQELEPAAIHAILVHTGLIEGPPGTGTPIFVRDDGAPGRVDRRADIVRLGRAPSWDTPLVVQVSRWDSLKDPLGVMHGFAAQLENLAANGAELVLAGPAVTGIADDPEEATVWARVVDGWHALPHAARDRVHLACLPMGDVEENAAIVNALQRHATVVVQKSLQEGFGLTVTEAMWKGRAVIASAVGGIQDQIQDGVHGILLKDSSDLEGFGRSLRRLLTNRRLSEKLGRNARERVRERFLGVRHLLEYGRLLDRLMS